MGRGMKKIGEQFFNGNMNPSCHSIFIELVYCNKYQNIYCILSYICEFM